LQLGNVLLKQPDGYSKGIAEIELANRLDPDAPYILRRLGEAYAHWGRWQEAAAPLRRASDLEPTNIWSASKHATLSLYLGDVENYRLACQRMLDADKPWGVACLLTPEGIGQLERVRQIVFDKPPRDQHRRNCRALADLRAGQWRSAIEEIDISRPSNRSCYDLLGLVILAMAQQGSGDLPAAQHTLARATALRAAIWPDPDQGRDFTDIWTEWLQAEILLREAEVLIAPPGNAKPAPP
jgi:tetratricopeptide (TPR) repeat protein